MKEVNVNDAQKQLSSLVAEAAAGEMVYITENGYRVLLMPVPKQGSILDIGKNPIDDELTDPPRGERIPGSAKGLFVIADNFDDPLEDFEEYMP
jgi:antitoxin (DNA-binding transcriptional repressor) of toxin-antitoxin stability system